MSSVNIYSNAPISPEQRTEAEQMHAEKIIAQHELDTMIATQPNLNDIYKEEIAAIQHEFQKDGLPIAPITVLEPAEFDEACRLIEGDDHKVGHFAGRFIGGHSLINAHFVGLSEQAKRDSLLTLGLHEAAHSVGDPPELSIIIKSYPGQSLGEYTVQLASIYGCRSNFSKLRIPTHEEGLWRLEGEFFEEGFADFKRVEALRNLGRHTTKTPYDLTTMTMPSGTNIKFSKDGESLPTIAADGTVNVPVDYLDFYTITHENDRGRLAVRPVYGANISCLAAYGIALLDQQAPGLFETMKAARLDSKHQAVFIKMINSIEPDLYGRLRRLKYDDVDFAEGLKMISSAVNKASAPAYEN